MTDKSPLFMGVPANPSSPTDPVFAHGGLARQLTFKCYWACAPSINAARNAAQGAALFNWPRN